MHWDRWMSQKGEGWDIVCGDILVNSFLLVIFDF